MRLEGKIAVITGTASGIGRAAALRFAQEGAKVVLADINEAGNNETAAQVTAVGGQVAAITTDVANDNDLQAMFDFAIETYGGLDIYYNNAYWTDAKTALETTNDNWQRTLDITLRPAWAGSKMAIPLLKGRGGGVILFTASVHSIVGVPGYAAYQASKGGMLSLTRALALELAADNIRVASILPGAINTPAVAISDQSSIDDLINLIPMGRLGEPEEIASVAAFLASDDASYITGTGIVADGGYTTP